jgi:putative ABC transport system permease protein
MVTGEQVRRDLAYALRHLRRSPLFAALAVLMLAVGIGAWTLMFSILNGLLLRPLQVHHQDQLVVARRTDTRRGVTELPFTEDLVVRFAHETRTFAAVSVMRSGGAWPTPMLLGDALIQPLALPVGGDLFSVLGVRAILGRTLNHNDDPPGAAPVVVISYGLWQRQFGGAPSVLGRMLRFNGRFHAIVGVMPPGFAIPQGTDVWCPLVEQSPGGTSRATWAYLALIGRLAPGVSAAAARAEFDAFVRQEAQKAPDDMPNAGVDVQTLRDFIAGSARPVVIVTTAASGLLLLLACINVANLFLIRSAGRQRELAVRAAVGAGRGALIRQLLTEHLVIGVAAGIAGLAMAAIGLRVFAAMAPPELPRVGDMRIDSAVLAATLAAALASTIFVGIGSALWLSRGDLLGALRSGVSGAADSPRGRSFKRGLVVAQVGLAQLVLIGAGLLVTSALRLEHLRLGFQADRLVVAQFSVAAPQFGGPNTGDFLDQLMPKLRAIPGVMSASVHEIPLLAGTAGWRSTFEARDQTPDIAVGNPVAAIDGVGSTFFQTLEIPVVRGHEFTDAELRGRIPVALVSQHLAERTWPGRDPIGQRIHIQLDSAQGIWRTVVGVVGDTRLRDLTTPMPSIYVPYTQVDDPATYLMVRTALPDQPLRAEILAAMRAISPRAWLLGAVPVRDVYAAPLVRPRLDAAALVAFAGIALLLAAAGIYGLAAAVVRQRWHELGIRSALGARPVDLARLVSNEGFVLAGIGIAIGSLTGLMVSRALASVLFEVQPTDPMTFATGAAFMVLVAGVALYVPSQRAARLDAATALRGHNT